MIVDPLTSAKQLPRGAVFHRCALQVNPHHYAGTFRGKANDGDGAQYARAIIDKALHIGITVLAITDHNSVAGVPDFRSAAAGTAIEVFPGFELCSREGVHVICIYPQATDDERMGRYLGSFGITNTAPSSDLADKGVAEILRMVREQGGVSIAAHVTGDKGLFKTLTGQPLIQAWRSPDLLAIQIPGRIDELPQKELLIVENRNPDYARTDAVEERQAIAIVNARDVGKPEDLEDPFASCWIKMSEISIDGLRQAFLDPGSRIRLNTKESQSLELDEHSELVAITWLGGFLDGVTIHFNPNLNVLVGGRGAGKSTIVESIRSVLGAEPLGEQARKAHEGVVKHVLKSGTKISLLVRVFRPSPREYRIERTIPNPPIVKDDQGQVSNLAPRDIIPRLDLYGQHEISELTKSPEKLTRLLERFVKRDETVAQRKNALRRDLEKNRRSLIDAREHLKQIEERLAALPGLEETLERFREAGLEDRLREKSLLVREEHILAGIPERLAPLRECATSLARPIDRAFLSTKALEELPGKDILNRANDVFQSLERDVQRIAQELAGALERSDQEFSSLRSEWDGRKRAVQTNYERILRELQKSKVDGEEFVRLREQIEKLRPLREQIALARRSEKELGDRRRALLAEWEDAKAAEFRDLDRAAKRVSKKLRDTVQVEITAAGNREPLFELLREEVGGQLTKALEALARVPALSLTSFVESCRTGPEAVQQQFGITPAAAERLFKAKPEVLMRVEELELPSITAIRLNTAPEGEPPTWQSLDDLSTGQKATAVLLLLLLDSEAPLVVDQPEDDLDNRFITEGIVPRMREEKQRRQFVFSTHNANIPVLGDAELIVGLEATGEANQQQAHAVTTQIGSIDHAPVRHLIEEILEGGKQAFERRRRKYGF